MTIGVLVLVSVIVGCEGNQNAAAPSNLTPTTGTDALEQMKQGAGGALGGADVTGKYAKKAAPR
jgi:hypothetical protein